LSFAACSKKADQSAAAEPSASAAVPAPAPATATPPPVEEEPVSFQLSGKPAPANANTPASPQAPDVEPARWLVQAPPFYPLSLRIQGIEGRVDVRVLINSQGLVDRAEVITSTEPRFNDHAVAALRASRFVPQRENGVAVPLVTDIPVPFVSEFGSASMPRNSPLALLAYNDGTFYMKGADGRLVPAEIEKPVRFAFLQPLLPATAKEGDSFKATIKVTVSEEGQPLNPIASNATSPEFAKALEAVMPFWQFLPKMKNGKPVKTTVEFPYVHNLNPAAKP